LRGMQLIDLLGLDVRGALELTTECCARFNADVPDLPDVQYFSISAARPRNQILPLARHSYDLISALEGENDGLVSVRSSTWGRHLGVWQADHWQSINHHYRVARTEPPEDITPNWLRLIQQVTS